MARRDTNVEGTSPERYHWNMKRQQVEGRNPVQRDTPLDTRRRPPKISPISHFALGPKHHINI